MFPIFLEHHDSLYSLRVQQFKLEFALEFYINNKISSQKYYSWEYQRFLCFRFVHIKNVIFRIKKSLVPHLRNGFILWLLDYHEI